MIMIIARRSCAAVAAERFRDHRHQHAPAIAEQRGFFLRRLIIRYPTADMRNDFARNDRMFVFANVKAAGATRRLQSHVEHDHVILDRDDGFHRPGPQVFPHFGAAMCETPVMFDPAGRQIIGHWRQGRVQGCELLAGHGGLILRSVSNCGSNRPA
jgi:hypothetical protein